jgi:hypothetical protein
MKKSFPMRVLLNVLRIENETATGKWVVATKKERERSKKNVRELITAIDKLK